MTMRFVVATVGTHVRVGLVSVVLIVMHVVMGGAAEEVHAAEAAHPNLLTNLLRSGLSSGFSSTHVGGYLGEETAHDCGALGIVPRGRNGKYVDDM